MTEESLLFSIRGFCRQERNQIIMKHTMKSSLVRVSSFFFDMMIKVKGGWKRPKLYSLIVSNVSRDNKRIERDLKSKVRGEWILNIHLLFSDKCRGGTGGIYMMMTKSCCWCTMFSFPSKDFVGEKECVGIYTTNYLYFGLESELVLCLFSVFTSKQYLLFQSTLLSSFACEPISFWFSCICCSWTTLLE